MRSYEIKTCAQELKSSRPVLWKASKTLLKNTDPKHIASVFTFIPVGDRHHGVFQHARWRRRPAEHQRRPNILSLSVTRLARTAHRYQRVGQACRAMCFKGSWPEAPAAASGKPEKGFLHQKHQHIRFIRAQFIWCSGKGVRGFLHQKNIIMA